MELVILGWIVAAIGLFVLPIFFRESDWQLWRQRWRQGRWNVLTIEDRNSSRQQQQQQQTCRDLSKEQEAEIRDAYLRDRLAPFTQTVQADAILAPLGADTSTARSSSSIHDSRSSLTEPGTSSSTNDEETSLDLERGCQVAVEGAENSVSAHESKTHSNHGCSDEECATTITTTDSGNGGGGSDTQTATRHGNNTTSADNDNTSCCSADDKKEQASDTGHAFTETCTSDGSTQNDDDDDDDDSTRAISYGHHLDWDEDEYGLVTVPFAGMSNGQPPPTLQQQESCLRQVSNSCAICLSPFEVNDQVTWAGNPDCAHVFHQACIASWLSMAGRKHVARRRRRQDGSSPLAAVTSHERSTAYHYYITQFPMLCPCCRQPFVASESTKRETNSKDKPAIEIVQGNHDIADVTVDTTTPVVANAV